MNIKEFKEGDFITRNEPMTYAHNGSADGSWLGDKMELLGVDEASKIIFLKTFETAFKDDDEPHSMSYARDRWDEGWTYYPTSLYERVLKKLK